MASVATAVAVSAQSPKCSLTWILARHGIPPVGSEYCLQTPQATAGRYHRSGELAFPQRNRDIECMQLLLQGWEQAVEMWAKGLLFPGHTCQTKTAAAHGPEVPFAHEASQCGWNG